MKRHKLNYGIYYRDIFDNKTFKTCLIGEFDTKVEATMFVENKYAGKISPSGANQVDIVNYYGAVIKSYKIGYLFSCTFNVATD